MDKSQVTIVIPIYNVEKYLAQCIDSVLHQTLREIQVILVDDGSGDSCGKICDHYKETDSRIFVLHKENGGLSSARNAAYPYIQSEFTFFLDSDDWLEADALEKLLDLQQEHQADIVVGNYYYSYGDHEDSAVQVLGNAVMSGYDALKNLTKGEIQNFAWGKLIRTELVRVHGFPEGKLFEDHFWTHFIFAEADTVVVSDQEILHYRQRADSISYEYRLSRLDMVDGWRDRAGYLEKNYPELLEGYLRFVSENYVNTCWLVCTRMKEDRRAAVEILRAFSREFSLMLYAESKNGYYIRRFERSVWSFCMARIIDRILDRLRVR